ncbi:hypothetical protein HMPREF0083_02410 [Aneurinibacillus aneurinilyticus ATCC 12856]|uniref:Uncharacterized protein n=1 Tax=Aneurinibacillus aneurinilyticus ATCC 12856 TaxID=649747 RepID=U1WLU2_ANEAE|nr:hypothetical protein HMPREF0083_02410 [Aneurinibacillus aneurinilyticus ATCC 12856]
MTFNSSIIVRCCKSTSRLTKEGDRCALRSGRRKANVSFSDRSRPPPFLLFLPLTTKMCQFIQSDVYK